VGLVLLHDLLALNFSGVGSLAPCPTPNLGDYGLHFISLLTFELSGIVGATRSIGSRQHISLGHWNTQTSSRQGSSPRGVYTKLGAFEINSSITNILWRAVERILNCSNISL
jgi:hypothetical protein